MSWAEKPLGPSCCPLADVAVIAAHHAMTAANPMAIFLRYGSGGIRRRAQSAAVMKSQENRSNRRIGHPARRAPLKAKLEAGQSSEWPGPEWQESPFSARQSRTLIEQKDRQS